jgi:hypothetical protein
LVRLGPVAELVGIEGGVVSGVFNLESSSVGAPDRRPRLEVSCLTCELTHSAAFGSSDAVVRAPAALAADTRDCDGVAHFLHGPRTRATLMAGRIVAVVAER